MMDVRGKSPATLRRSRLESPWSEQCAAAPGDTQGLPSRPVPAEVDLDVPGSRWLSLHPSYDDQDQNDDQDHADDTHRAIAVGVQSRSRERSRQKQDQDHEQHDTQCRDALHQTTVQHDGFLSVATAGRVWRSIITLNAIETKSF